jgi:DNA-binding HxlR family transcriptional regulator
MTTRKYDMRCPVARTMNVIGDRWAILIVRDLILLGPRRFQDFERSLNGITPAVLSTRLTELEEHGIIGTRLYAEHPPRMEYSLTQKGADLRPVLGAMKRWGETYA